VLNIHTFQSPKVAEESYSRPASAGGDAEEGLKEIVMLFVLVIV